MNFRTKSQPPTIEILVEGKPRRWQKEPVWMTDYEEGKGLSNDEVNAIFVAANDPITFEEALKNKKRRDAM